MVIRNISEVERAPVRMDGAERASMAVLVGREQGAPNFAMRVISVDAGGHTPRHSHDYERSYLIDSHYGLSGTLDPATMIYPLASVDFDINPMTIFTASFLALPVRFSFGLVYPSPLVAPFIRPSFLRKQKGVTCGKVRCCHFIWLFKRS